MDRNTIEQQIQDLKEAIQAQENLRGQLSDAIINATLATLQEKLAALQKDLEESTRRRKLVTILFADVAGSTAMAENLDPEVWAGIIDEAFAHFIQPVEAHRGQVARLMGDAILAFFGAQRAHVEDPQLAVLAGLSIIESMKPLQERVRREHGLDFNIRVGINTGDVLLGQFGVDGTGEFTAMGDAVNLASRLEHAAPPGEVLISKDTLDLLEGLFDCQPYREIQFKGKTTPVPTYLVRGRCAPAPRGRITTPFVGREKELAFLSRVLQRAKQRKSPQALTLLGEAGIGKTRLLKEFLKTLPETAFPVRLTALISPESEHLPLRALQSIVWDHIGALQSDSREAVREKMRQKLGEILSPPEISAAAVFLGVKTAGEQQAHLTELGQGYLMRYFKTLASQGPLLFVLEDLHWADQASLSFLTALLKQAAGTPLVVIALARPALLETHNGWMQSATTQMGFSHRIIQLTSLNEGQTRDMILKMLDQVRGIPDKLCHLILHMTNGNPFYVEALLQMFNDEGLIVREQGRWVAYLEQMNTIQLPRTLKGVLQARLDRLSGGEKQVLQQAAVVGAVFWDEVLQQLGETRQLSEDIISRALKSQMDKGLVREADHSLFKDTREYLFKHALLRDTAYDSLLLAERRDLHRQVAEWLLVKGAERMLEYVGVIAYHYEKSQALELARPWLEEAARKALRTSSYYDAVYYFNKALAIVEARGEDETNRLEILDGLSAAYDRLGRYDEAFAAARDVQEKARSLGLDALVAKSASRLSWLTQLRGEQAESQRWAEKALEAAERTGDNSLIARALTNLAGKYENSDLEKELELYRQALALLQETGNRLGVAVTYLNMGNVCFHQGHYETARAHYEKSQALYTELDNLWGIENCLGNIGIVHHKLGETETAEEHIRQALKIARDIGDQEGIVIMHLNLGYTGFARGDRCQAKQAWLTAVKLGWSLGLVPLALDGLCGLSGLLAEKDAQKARRAMAAVLGHPAQNVEIEDNAREIMAAAPAVFEGLEPLSENEAVSEIQRTVAAVAGWLD